MPPCGECFCCVDATSRYGLLAISYTCYVQMILMRRQYADGWIVNRKKPRCSWQQHLTLICLTYMGAFHRFDWAFYKIPYFRLEGWGWGVKDEEEGRLKRWHSLLWWSLLWLRLVSRVRTDDKMFHGPTHPLGPAVKIAARTLISSTPCHWFCPSGCPHLCARIQPSLLSLVHDKQPALESESLCLRTPVNAHSVSGEYLWLAESLKNKCKWASQPTLAKCCPSPPRRHWYRSILAPVVPCLHPGKPFKIERDSLWWHLGRSGG